MAVGVRARRVLAVAAIAAATIAGTGCGGKSGDGDASDGTGTTEAARTTTAEGVEETGLAEAGAPKRGGKVVYGLEAETTGGWCLPEAQLAVSGAMVANAVYDPLMYADVDGKPKPYLAESVTGNDDGTTWTVRLRDGVTFHDGSTLDAEVVKNNLLAGLGKYEGRSGSLGPVILSDVKGVEVVEPMTVRITTAPWPAFPSYLTSARVMAQAQLDDPDRCDRDLIGTGPFRFESWTPNQALVVERNPDYWQVAPDGEPYPYLDEIEFRPVPEELARMNGFEAGDLDVVHTSVAKSIGGPLTDLADDGKANLLVSDRFAEINYTLLNAGRPPFDDARFRRAVAHAIDREALNETVNDGHATVASGPFAPGVIGHLDDSGFPEHDPAKAEALVKEYVADGGKPSFVFTLTQDPGSIQRGELIQEQLADVGIEMRIDPIDQSTLINRAVGGKFQSLAFRNLGGADPDAAYAWWVGKDSVLNLGNIDDPEIDRLMKAGRAETDEATRTEIYEDVNRRFAEQVWNVWSWYTRWGVAEQADVHGVLGPELPDDGGDPYNGLSGGHRVLGLWRSD